ncbi:MAG: hypothetical protein V4553_22440 [Bacteroidota bacterium]
MKTITLHTSIDSDQLLDHIQQKLNPLFWEQRQQRIVFSVVKNGEGIDISQEQMYDGPLFHLEVKGLQVLITRNEHYVDDVNSLTIESILNSLFEDLTGDIRGVDLVTEG